ncbi:MAG: PQQ-binding-like beta-propeller repeat protein [Phycisphaera sp.]|nr:PQQ-binding-like beta-propeller repeat protein [Phycisphaera sp.]
MGTHASSGGAVGRLAVIIAATAAVTWAAVSPASAENWPRFGGADGSFHSGETGVPVKWTKADVAWRVDLPGRGQSSPVVWGDRIYVTSASTDGKTRSVLCVNRADGKTLWRADVPTTSHEDLHKMNSYATPTCATDGQRVVAFFGPAGLHCFDAATGKPIWSRTDLGPLPFVWGTAASPVIVDDMVVQNCDAIGPSYLIAVNKESGKTIWKTERKEKPKGGWSTPFVIDTGKRRELILNGEFGVKGYDPKTGAELWFCKSFNGRGTPIPAWAHGTLITLNGLSGDIYAVKPGGSGDVTKTHMAWHTTRKGGRDLPSPVVVGDYIFTVSMSGIASGYNAKTGETLFVERMDATYSGSPVVVAGLVYITSEAGVTSVVKPGDKLAVTATNSVGATGDEIFRATPAISEGQVFLRSDTALYCVGRRAAE